MSRLLLLDGHSLAYRAFFALPAENFSTSTGQHTNAVYGFTSMLINMLRDEEPTHVVVAFDKARQSFRTEEYAEYKAGRARTPDEFQGQIPLVKEILDALRIRYVELDGYEADDIIATFATQAEAKDIDVLICSGDRDTFQLVSDRVTILYPVRGVSEVSRMGPTQVEEKYGVPPTRYSDLAAMVGESSDNLPGVPGVGPKTAAKWITQYGDLDGIVAGVDPGDAGQVLGRLADHGREVAVAGRRHAVLLLDLCRAHPPHLGHAAHGVEDRDVLGDQLEGVTVAGADEHLDALGVGLGRDGGDDVVGLVALELDVGDAQRVEHLLDEGKLTRELVGRARATRLVLGVLLGAERLARLVERDDDVRRLLVAEHVDQHGGAVSYTHLTLPTN